MKVRKVVFTGIEQVELQEESFDERDLQANDVLVEAEYSVISAGTELSCLCGIERQYQFPGFPGYGAVGKVCAVGSAVSDVSIGQRVFHYGRHASHSLATGLLVPVPDDVDPLHAVIARMAQVAFTALRVSEAELGDTVAVIGLGQVGNLASQLFARSGCRVIGIDVNEHRLEIARSCGIEWLVHAGEEDPVEAVRRITGGEMCETVVEASGVTDQSLTAARLAGPLGEVVLVGSPRKEASFNALEVLRQIHLWPNGCVTFKGAHEWRYPIRHDPRRHTKHSLERNVRLYMRLLQERQLQIAPLITQVADPEKCASVYEELRRPDSKHLGVVFRWAPSAE